MRRYLPFLLILFVVAAILRVDFFFTVAYLFFLLYLLGRLWMRRSLGRVSVIRRFTSRAFSGDEVQVEVKLGNTGLLPVPWLQIHESLPIDLIAPPFHREVFTLGAGERRFFYYQLHCRKRGLFWLGPLLAQTGDLLGLEPERSTEFAAEPLVVYPRVVQMARVKLPTRSPLAALATRTPMFEDPARVTGVRDYQRGDSPRRIHWTATASAGRLLVKQYQPTVARETMLALDLNTTGYENRFRFDASELAIIAAASLANHVIMRDRLALGLATEALDPLTGAPRRFYLPARPERAHLITVLEALARVQLAPGPALGEILRRERPRLAWGTTVVAITGRADEGLFDAMAGLRQAGFAVTLILVQCSQPLAAIQARAAVLGVALWPIWREQDLEQRP